MTWMICGHLGVPHDLGNLHLDGPFARGFEVPGHASLVRWLPILMRAEASDAPERQMVSEDSEDWVLDMFGEQQPLGGKQNMRTISTFQMGHELRNLFGKNGKPQR